MNELSKPSTAFYITSVVLFIVFLVVINQLPIASKYSFGQMAFFCLGCCMVGAFIYQASIGITATIFKVLVEVASAILLFGNVLYVAVCWSNVDHIAADFNLGVFPTCVILSVLLLLIDFLLVFVLYPLARIAGVDLEKM